MDIPRLKKIYMIGIKGVGMTMLAEYWHGQGVNVSGSDTADRYMTDQVLKKNNIKVIEKFDANDIPKDADLIIYSTAYNAERNAEVAAALAGKIKTLTYAEALAQVFNQKYGIAVVGSHGKTTTTAWLGFVMDKAGLSPSVMAGARVPQFDGAGLAGKSDYLVAELDEYQNKLQYFHPKVALVNNIDYDHPDWFATPDDYKNAFIDFIKKIPVKGLLVANLDDKIIKKVALVNCHGKVVTYAINEAADYVAYDIKCDNGKQYFKVKFGTGDSCDEAAETEDLRNYELGDFNIQLAGKHNIYNGLAVIATSVELGIELYKLRTYLAKFSGTARRLQVLGQFRGATIIDDYAHHPTEIKATLEGVRQTYGNKKLIVVFHPHTFTRTKALLDDFAKSFTEADELIVLDIYGSAREQQGGITSQNLVDKIISQNQKSKIKNQTVKYIPTLDECEKYLRKYATRGDVVLLMGAGDVFRVGERLLGFPEN